MTPIIVLGVKQNPKQAWPIFGLLQLAFLEVNILNLSGMVNSEDPELLIGIESAEGQLDEIVAFLISQGIEITRGPEQISLDLSDETWVIDQEYQLVLLIGLGKINLAFEIKHLNSEVIVTELASLTGAYTARHGAPTVDQFFKYFKEYSKLAEKEG